MPTRVQQDASLAFDLGGKGVTNDKIIKAVDKAHIDPSVGDSAKIHGDIKGQVAGGYIAGGYLEGVLSEDKFAINSGVTKVLGWHADVSADLTFGPYPIKVLQKFHLTSLATIYKSCSRACYSTRVGK